MSAAKKKQCAVPEPAAVSASTFVPPKAEKYWLRRIVIFFIALVWFGLFAPLGIDLHHDGVMMIPALRVAQGGMVFRDVFCQYGFLSPVLQGLALKIGGGELLVMKYFSVLFYAGSAVMLDILWQELLSKHWRNLLLLMMFSLMPDTVVTFHAWSSVFALFFSLLSLWGQLKYLKSGKWYWLFAGGAAAGLTFLSRHPVGVVTLIAIFGMAFFESGAKNSGMASVRQFFKLFFIALGGFALVCGSVAILLIAAGAWDDFIFQTFTSVFKFVGGRGDGWKWEYLASSLCPFVTDNGLLDSIFAIIPILSLPWLYIASRRMMQYKKAGKQIETRDLILCSYVIFALGAWHQYYPVPCVRHIFWGGVPFFGFFVLTVEALLKRKEDVSRKKWLLRGVAGLLFLWYGMCAYWRVNIGVMRALESKSRRELNVTGVRGILFGRGEAGVITTFRGIVDGLPENIRARGVLNYTKDGVWSVILPDCGFRHKQFIRWKDLYPDYDQKVFEFIREKRPVVLSNEEVELDRYSEVFTAEYMGESYRFYIPWE